MVAIVLSMAGMMSFTTQRSESHCYTVWHYNKPQRGCSAPQRHFTRILHVKYERERIAPNQEQTTKKPDVKPASLWVTRCDDHCVGWPSVEWTPAAEGPDRWVGIAKLRALRNE